MEEVLARARLIGSTAIEGQAVMTTVPRAELEQAVRSDGGPPDLLLRVERVRPETGERTEARMVAVAFERRDLEELLARTATGDIALAFEPDGLERALAAPEVEAHGFRETAAVLTVAAFAAAGSAGTAQAREILDVEEESAGPAATHVAPAEPIPANFLARADRASAGTTPDRSTPPASVAADEGGISLPGPEPSTLAVAGGLALLITGAGFALREQRRRHTTA